MQLMKRYEEYISTKDENGVLAYIGTEEENPFSLEERAIIQLQERVNSYNTSMDIKDKQRKELLDDMYANTTIKDKKIKELLKELELNNNICFTLKEKNSNQKMQIAKLWEHIDVLENNPFRRLYNSIASMFKYRVKLVKIGDNQ